ncbi:MAG: GMC family oxidoreductase [Myxococcota bacterium]
MHIDARDYDQATLTGDVCVIGGGAAGITLAVALSKSGLSTIVVESGGFERTESTDQLNAAQTPTIGGDYLLRSRVRVFGGTTSHWTGLCLPLADPTFEARPWVPNSGWPIDGDVLHSYYQAACEFVGIEPWGRQGQLTRSPELTTLEFSQHPGRFETRIYQVKRRAHFGRRHRDTLTEAEGVILLTHATCTGLEVTGPRVERAVVRTLTERRIAVDAKIFVLAAGGIENARLLLVSNDAHPKGVGNIHDRVGRFYMDHPELTVAEAMVWPGWDLDLYLRGRLGDDSVGFGALFPTPSFARERGLLQAGIQIRRSGHRWGTPQGRSLDRAVTTASFRFDCVRGAHPKGACLPAMQRAALFARSEQAPDPANRVVLGETKDVFGVRQPRLEWRMNALDARSLKQTVQELARAIYRDGLGRVRSFLDHQEIQTLDATYGPSMEWEDYDRIHHERRPKILLWGHHMGTTRMADSPRHGVVDRNCAVHGIANLYIAGSSVFPTGGAANPTLTIVALALRLAEHLQRTVS